MSGTQPRSLQERIAASAKFWSMMIKLLISLLTLIHMILR
jgi:hypothetical protein